MHLRTPWLVSGTPRSEEDRETKNRTQNRGQSWRRYKLLPITTTKDGTRRRARGSRGRFSFVSTEGNGRFKKKKKKTEKRNEAKLRNERESSFYGNSKEARNSKNHKASMRFERYQLFPYAQLSQFMPAVVSPPCSSLLRRFQSGRSEYDWKRFFRF